jgi:Ca2+-binding RTX toxin-like protein
MGRTKRPVGGAYLHPLERRRLLTLMPVGPELLTPLASTSGFDTFDIAVARDGSYLIAGVVSFGESGSLMAVRYSTEGEQIGQPLTLDNSVSTGIELCADMDGDGDAVVAYTESGISVVRISKEGVVAAPQQVATVTRPSDAAAAFLSDPAVSMDSGGDFFLGWNRNVDFGTDWIDAIHLRAFNADGTPRGDEIVVTEHRSISTFLHELDVASKPDGSGAVFAYDESGEILGNVWVGRVSVDELLGNQSLVRGDGQIGWPDVAVHEDGSFLVGYDRTPQGRYEPRAFVQRYNAGGDAEGDAIDLAASLNGLGGDALTGLTGRIAVAVMPQNGFVAAFVHEQDGVATLYARRYFASGAGDSEGLATVARTAPLDERVSQFAPPAVVADPLGNVLVAHRSTEDAPVRYRHLMSNLAEVAVVDGVLQVIGKPGADSITVAREGDGEFVVTQNGKTTRIGGGNSLFIESLDGDDVIVNDTALPSLILGGAGNDKIAGGSGADSVSGGDGRDKLLGRDGKDSLSGNAGYDTLEGGLGADRLAGNGGRDRLYGNGGNDRLFGGAQGDWLYGQNGSDLLFGDGGNDRLYDDYASGVDTLHGGNGDDLLVSRDSLADELFGGRGNDTSVADFTEDQATEVELGSLD